MVKNFATNLNKCLKDHDLAARLGGGEFVVLLGDTTTNSADAFLLDLQSRMDARGRDVRQELSHQLFLRHG